MDVDKLGFALGMPLSPAILEVSDEFLLLGVDGDHGDTTLEAPLGCRVDVLELRVSIRVLRAFNRLVWYLQVVVVILEHLGDGLVADSDAVLREQLRGECVGALTRPAQRRFRIATRHRIDELLEHGPHVGARRLERPRPAAASNLDHVTRLRAGAGLVPSFADGADRHARRTRHHGHPAVSNRPRFGPCPQPTSALIHGRLQQPPLLANRALDVHRERRSCRGASCRSTPIHFERDSIDTTSRGP